jgi:hypothetical protein
MFSIREHLRNYCYYLENTIFDAFKVKRKEILSSKPSEVVPDIPCITVDLFKDLSEEETQKPTIIIPSDSEIRKGPYIPESKIGSYFVANENFKKFKGPLRRRLDGSYRSNSNNGQVDLPKGPSSKVSE